MIRYPHPNQSWKTAAFEEEVEEPQEQSLSPASITIVEVLEVALGQLSK